MNQKSKDRKSKFGDSKSDSLSDILKKHEQNTPESDSFPAISLEMFC